MNTPTRVLPVYSETITGGTLAANAMRELNAVITEWTRRAPLAEAKLERARFLLRIASDMFEFPDELIERVGALFAEE